MSRKVYIQPDIDDLLVMYQTHMETLRNTLDVLCLQKLDDTRIHLKCATILLGP